jgi:hypothetical protein
VYESRCGSKNSSGVFLIKAKIGLARRYKTGKVYPSLKGAKTSPLGLTLPYAQVAQDVLRYAYVMLRNTHPRLRLKQLLLTSKD